jgi:hypothetical protein
VTDANELVGDAVIRGERYERQALLLVETLPTRLLQKLLVLLLPHLLAALLQYRTQTLYS